MHTQLSDAETGETFLTLCAKNGQLEAMSSWLDAPGASWAPTAALHAAIEAQAEGAAMVLLTHLTPCLNVVQGACLNDALCLLAERMPHKVLAALIAIEPSYSLPPPR